MILGISIVAGIAGFLLVLALQVAREERKQKILSYLQRDLLVKREQKEDILCRLGCTDIFEKENKRVEGTGLEVVDVVMAKLFGSLAIVIIFAFGGWWLLGLIIAGVYVYTINFFLKKKKQYRKKLFESQVFIDFLLNLASTLNIVPGFLEALESVVAKADSKIQPELAKIIEEHKAGVALGEALVNFAERTASPTIMAWAEGIVLAREHGGNLAEVCTQAAEKLRLKKKIEKEIRATAMNAKATAIGIAGVLIVMIFVQIASGQYEAVLASAWGRLTLSVIIGLFIAGSFVVYNIVEKEAEL